MDPPTATSSTIASPDARGTGPRRRFSLAATRLRLNRRTPLTAPELSSPANIRNGQTSRSTVKGGCLCSCEHLACPISPAIAPTKCPQDVGARARRAPSPHASVLCVAHAAEPNRSSQSASDQGGRRQSHPERRRPPRPHHPGRRERDAGLRQRPARLTLSLSRTVGRRPSRPTRSAPTPVRPPSRSTSESRPGPAPDERATAQLTSGA